MLSNSLKRLNRTNRLTTVDDFPDDYLSGQSVAHSECWKYLQLSSSDAALDRAEQIIKIEPNKPDGYVFKGRALFQKGRYQEAEEVLLKVMKIAEDYDLILTDPEGIVKLKDELANSRVEILRSRNFREPIDIAEMHWNDCHKPILELIGFASSRGSRDRDESPTNEVDVSIVDIIGTEKAKQLYPKLNIHSSPRHKSTPQSSKSFSGFSNRRDVSSSNLNLSAEFPLRERDRTSVRPQNTSNRSKDNSDLELTTAGLRTALLLAEEKHEKCERKVKNLEEELRKAYEKVIKLNDEKNALEKKCETLVDRLDEVKANRSSTLYSRQSEPDIEILSEVPYSKRKRALDPLRRPYNSKPPPIPSERYFQSASQSFQEYYHY